MKKYQAIRLYDAAGRCTYGDLYRTVTSDKELEYNEIYTTTRGERVQILFEMES